MKRREMLLALGAGMFTPLAAMAQEKPEVSDDDLMLHQQELNGYSASPEVIEMVLGDEDAPVTIHEFASFSCPHCANFHANQFQKLKTEYIDTGKVRFIFRDVYMDRPSLWGSMLARCSGPEHFFETAALLFHNQGVWATAETTDMLGFLSEIGAMVGMTDADLSACYENQELAKNLVDWSGRERSAADVTSTPTLLINGEKYPNMTFEGLSKIIDDLL